MAAGYSLKDQLFNTEKVRYLAGLFGAADPAFDSASFERQVMTRLLDLELKQRIQWIADCLSAALTGPLPETAPLLRAAMPPPLDPTLTDNDFGDFIFAPLGEYVVAAGLEEHETVVVDVEHGDALPDPHAFAGVLVTGSAAFVTDHAEWSERSAAWLRQAAHDDLPVFGICYGHQLLAHALGGEVAYNPAGRESGTIELELQPQAAQDPLFQGLPQHFAAHATHLQTVLRAPDGAEVLARSPLDGCHAFRWGRQAWGVQFHPEFATHHMRGYVRARADCIGRHGGCARSIERAVSAAPLARQLLRRFVRQARLSSAQPAAKQG